MLGSKLHNRFVIGGMSTTQILKAIPEEVKQGYSVVWGQEMKKTAKVSKSHQRIQIANIEVSYYSQIN